MKKQHKERTKNRLAPLFFAQFLCLTARVGIAGVQIVLLHILTHHSVTIHLPFPAETARFLGTISALFLTLLPDLFLLSPFYLGLTAFRYDSAVNTPPVSACFAAYKHRRYGLSVRWRLVKWGIMSGSGLLCFFPALCLFWLSGTSDFSASSAAILLPLAASLLCVSGGIVWGIWMLRYAAAGFYVPETGCVRTALKRSVRVTRHRKNALIRLFFRFGGGFLLCVFILPSLIVIPLFYRALACTINYPKTPLVITEKCGIIKGNNR